MDRSLGLFFLRRLLSVVGVMLTVAALVWLMLHGLRPESFFPDPRPLPVELADYLWHAFVHFDLGRSTEVPFTPVSDLIATDLPADVSLLAGAFLFGLAAGSLGGVVAARFAGTPIAGALHVVAVFLLSAPVYWLGLVVILVLEPGVGTYEPVSKAPLQWASALALPWMVAGAPLAAACLRMSRSGVRDAENEDFVRTAVAKGLGPWAVTLRHTLPAAGAPVMVLAAAYTPLLVGNVVLVEQVFNIPGVFRRIPHAVSEADFPLLQGLTIVGAAMVVIMNLTVDVALARLDPRVRSPS
jgi:peptide/nickel transport system permease protein